MQQAMNENVRSKSRRRITHLALLELMRKRLEGTISSQDYLRRTDMVIEAAGWKRSENLRSRASGRVGDQLPLFRSGEQERESAVHSAR